MSTTTNAIDFDGLRKVVEAVRETWFWQFSMGRWCGTACCAIGNWCKRHPEDRLRMWRTDCGYTPWLGGMIGYSAVAERFGIDRSQAIRLFSPTSYRQNSRAAVIARIEQFIRDHESTDPRN